MRRIRIQNPVLDKTYRTAISSDYSSGTSLSVLNTNSFSTNDLLVVGEPSEELTELKKLSSLTAPTTFTLASALNFAHGRNTPIYKSIWEYVSIESRSSSGGVFAEISQSPIQWDNKNNETIYFDSDATDSYEYRFRFYNSVTGKYSEYSPTLTGAGFTRSSVGYMIREIRKVVNDLQRKIVTDEEIIRMLNRAQDIVYAHNARYWFLLVNTYKGNNGIAVTANTVVYSLATYSTFGHLDTLRVHYNSGGNSKLYPLRKLPSSEFDLLVSDLNRGSEDWIYTYTLLPADSSSSAGYIQIDTIPKTSGINTLYPNYYEKMSNLESVEDETQVPMPDILEDFAISLIEKQKGNEDKAKLYMSLFMGPPDQKKGIEEVTGIRLLDQMDFNQKNVAGNPRQLWNFRGRGATRSPYSRSYMNRDYVKEYYME